MREGGEGVQQGPCPLAGGEAMGCDVRRGGKVLAPSPPPPHILKNPTAKTCDHLPAPPSPCPYPRATADRRKDAAVSESRHSKRPPTLFSVIARGLLSSSSPVGNGGYRQNLSEHLFQNS
mmetsp:Transcript_11406/g.28866  ORF Transcript_11406/g.28866 Transcript_11406/m.28866 type:complete len:120 (+) Transcript_11406:198-557(+)